MMFKTASDQDGEHPHTSEPLTVDKGIHPHGDHNKHRSPADKYGYILRQREGDVAGAKQIEHRFVDEQTEYGQKKAGADQQSKRVPHIVFCFRGIAPAVLHGAQWRTAVTIQVGKGGRPG